MEVMPNKWIIVTPNLIFWFHIVIPKASHTVSQCQRVWLRSGCGLQSSSYRRTLFSDMVYWCGRTTLHIAIQAKRHSEVLIAKKADVNSVDGICDSFLVVWGCNSYTLIFI